jgi:NDP-sugar pyrophosphorylase family protein
VTQVVILAGGMGERLGALSESCPKALQQVGGRPFIHHLLDRLRGHGFHSFHLCLGHLADQVLQEVDEYRARAPSFALTYHVDPAPLGTGGALKSGADALDSDFLLVMGDTLVDFDLPQLVDALGPHDLGLMLTTTARCGTTPNTRVRAGRVVQYSRSPRSTAGYLTDTGALMLRRSALSHIPQSVGLRFDLGVLHRKLIESHALAAMVTDRPFYDIGTPDRLKRISHAVGKGTI